MEVPTALLVALMFVTLISIGIGNILMSLASMVDRRSTTTATPLHISPLNQIFELYSHSLGFVQHPKLEINNSFPHQSIPTTDTLQFNKSSFKISHIV